MVAVPTPEFAIKGGDILPPVSGPPFAVNQRWRVGKGSCTVRVKGGPANDSISDREGSGAQDKMAKLTNLPVLHCAWERKGDWGFE